MNIIPKLHYCIGPTPLAFACLTVSLGIAPRLVSAPPAEPSPEVKTHTLFMGADFDVQQKKDFFRVHGVSGGAFVITVEGQEHLVPMTKGPVNMRVIQNLKLTKDSATIANLKSERAYTPAADPQRRFNSEVGMGGAAQDVTNLAAGRMVGAEATVNYLQGHLNAPAGSGMGGAMAAAGAARALPQAQANLSSAQRGFNSASFQAGSDFNNSGVYAARLQEELAKELFDAMEVSFEVSSPKPLSDPYMVIVAQYHESDEKPGTVHNWYYAREIEPIGIQPRKVRFLQGGLPPGFKLEKFQVHLYNRGQELATSVADKQVALSREEAFEYLLLDYLSSHKSATIPAASALGRPSLEARARLTADQFQQIFYVKVNKDGLPETSYLDEACSRKVEDPFIETLIKDVRFLPTLVKGHPADGVARLKFSELAI